MGQGEASINVRSAECLDTHAFAVLVGVGATAVNAYLAQDCIAGHVAVLIVQALEAIDVDQQDGSAVAGWPWLSQRLLAELQEAGAAGRGCGHRGRATPAARRLAMEEVARRRARAAEERRPLDRDELHRRR